MARGNAKPKDDGTFVPCGCEVTKGGEMCICSNTKVVPASKAGNKWICTDCGQGKHQFM